MKKLITLTICFVFSLTIYGQNILTETDETFKNGTWVNNSKHINTYDMNGSRTYYLYQLWDITTSSWKKNYQVNYINNNNGKIQQLIGQYWIDSSSSWINTARNTFTYNDSNKILTTTYEFWTGETWVNSSKYNYTYDGSGYLTLQLRQSWDVPTSSWKNAFQTTYLNNGNGLVQEYIEEAWDIPSNSWKNLLKGVYTYNGSNKIISATSKIYQGETWVNYSKDDNLYDKSGYATYNLEQVWDSKLNEWRVYIQYNYTNNVDGTVQQLISEMWDIPSSLWKYWNRSTYTYATPTGIQKADNISFQLLPNPSNGILNLSLIGSSNTEIEIKDLQGKLLLSKQTSETSVTIDIKELPSNLYFLHLKQCNKVSTTKFIKD